MSERLLVCVNSAPAALAAARLSIDMAARHGGELRALCITEDLPGGSVMDGPTMDDREREGRVILARIESMAEERGASIETVSSTGDPLRVVMEVAEQWNPDLILIGRTGRRGPGSPMLGSLTSHVLEFSKWPVVVVPADYRLQTN
jgi:nucleotide-binding universal stress UspA family protein